MYSEQQSPCARALADIRCQVISSLRAQLQQLRQDVTRLTIEKDNIARYANEVPTMAIPYATEGANGSPANENNFLRRAPEPHWQQIEYEAVAKRASERLLEQSRHIEGLERELYGLRMSGCLPAQGQEYGAPSKNSPLAPDRQKDHQHASGVRPSIAVMVLEGALLTAVSPGRHSTAALSASDRRSHRTGLFIGDERSGRTLERFFMSDSFLTSIFVCCCTIRSYAILS